MLQHIYAGEWRNFCERCAVDHPDIFPSMSAADLAAASDGARLLVHPDHG